MLLWNHFQTTLINRPHILLFDLFSCESYGLWINNCNQGRYSVSRQRDEGIRVVQATQLLFTRDSKR